VIVEDEEGVGGKRGAKSGEAVDLADAGAGLPRPGTRPGVETEEGYQIVTRAKGKPKQAGKAAATRLKPGVFQSSQEAEVSKKRWAEDALTRSSGGSSTADQIEDVKSLVLRLLDQGGRRAQEEEERMEDICDLRQEVKELKKLIQVSNNKTQGLT
jgi:hypothetical protein